MDPIRVPLAVDPLPRGASYFIPFECFNIQKTGESESRIALDLPPMRTLHEAKTYLMNNQSLAGRAIDYREYGRDERKSIEIIRYLELYKEGP